jgi:uncharacterized protein (DUF1330 family)
MDMTAYVVFTRVKTINPAELEIYAPKARASMAGHAVTRHAAYGRQQVLEGPQTEGVVILSFPTFEEAQAWYNSPAYKEACEHRFKGAEYRAVIVEGI